MQIQNVFPPGRRGGVPPHAKWPLLYFLVSAAYIIGSSLLASAVVPYDSGTLLIEIAKGLVFVVATTAGFWYLLFREYRARRSTEIRYQALVENLPDGLFVLGLPERRILYANPAACRMYGYEANEMVGQTTEFLHVSAEAFHDFRDRARDALRGERSMQIEYRARRRNGETFPSDHVVSIVRDEEGLSYAISIIRDLSAKVDQEQALRDSERRFRELAENLREVFWISSPDKSAMEYVSPAYEQIWGRPVADIYANPMAFLEAVHPDDQAYLRSRLASQVSGGYDVQYRIVRPDGEVRWIWDRAVPIADADGRVTHVIGIAEDITQLKVQTAELLHAQKLEAMGQLAGGIAHDLNNGLLVIRATAEELDDALRDQPALRAMTRRIVESTENAATRTRRLMVFSRDQALRPEAVEPNAVIESLAAVFRRTLGEHIAIDLRLDPASWPVTVDRALFESSLMNLAINARDAMPDGGRLTISTANVAAPAGGRETVMIAVADTGSGMTPEVADRVFEPFFSTKDIGKGTGLGLSMTYGFIAQSGGRIELDTAVGQGSTFRLYLPRAAVEALPIPAAAGEPARRGSGTILAVEDEPDVRALIRRMLERLGYDVLEAATGPEALAAVEANAAIDLVITDVVLPGGMSGAQVAAEVARRRPGLRVLFTSGYSEADAFKSAGLPVDLPLLRKPYSRAELAAAVSAALERPATLGDAAPR